MTHIPSRSGENPIEEDWKGSKAPPEAVFPPLEGKNRLFLQSTKRYIGDSKRLFLEEEERGLGHMIQRQFSFR